MTPDLSPWPVGPLLQGWAHERVCLLEAENARLRKAMWLAYGQLVVFSVSIKDQSERATHIAEGLEQTLVAAAAALRPTTTDTEE